MEPRHLISPNLHVILVHFPLGIFVFGVFLEVFSFLWRRSAARLAGRWMILFGGLLAVPAALTGIDALQDVLNNTRGTLSDIQIAMLNKHVLLASIGAGVAALTVTVALGLSDLWRKRLYFPILALLVASAGVLTFGSHFGGEGVYLDGTAIKLKGDASTGIEYWAPAEGTHVLLAGLSIAAALAALGASLRVLSTINTRREEEEQAVSEHELAALAVGGGVERSPRRVTDDISVARTLNADAELPAPRAPAGRFWTLAAALFLITFGFGVWLLVSQEDTTFDLKTASASSVYKEVVSTARATPQLSNNRRGAHIVLGCALVLLPLLLALAVRFMPRQKILVGSLCVLMAAVIGLELWMGILLIHDDAEGPLFKFKPASQSLVIPSLTHRSAPPRM